MDTVVTTAMLVGMTAALVSAARENCPPDAEYTCGMQALLAVPLGVVGVPYGISALYGHATVSGCQGYKHNYKLALDAARARDCNAVRRIVTDEDLDASLRNEKDVALRTTIEQCLGPRRAWPSEDGDVY